MAVVTTRDVNLSSPPLSGPVTPGQALLCPALSAILSVLGKLKDLSQIDGVVPVFGLLLTTPLIISKNKQLHTTLRPADDARPDMNLVLDRWGQNEKENVFE